MAATSSARDIRLSKSERVGGIYYEDQATYFSCNSQRLRDQRIIGKDILAKEFSEVCCDVEVIPYCISRKDRTYAIRYLWKKRQEEA